MKKLLALLLLIPILAYAANTPPPGVSGDVITNGGSGKYGAFTLSPNSLLGEVTTGAPVKIMPRNNLSFTTTGGVTYLDATVTGSSSTSALGTTTTANPYRTGELSTGFFSSGSGQVGVEALSSPAMSWTSTGVTVQSIPNFALVGTATGGLLNNITPGAGLVLTATSLNLVGGSSTPTGPAGGDLGGTYPNPTVTSILDAIPTPTAYQFLSATTSTSFQWTNAANLIDPRTYGAACVGPGYTGGLSSGSQGTLITNGGSSYTTGTYTAVPLTGGTGSGAQATVIVASGAVTTVTITTAGTGYKLRDQLSASAADIGGTGSGFIVQVSHFSANHSPVYDGVHDDSAAFKQAFAVAQNTGQAVLVPNGCWISPTTTPLRIPQGVNMVGEGFAPSYGYNINGGTADDMPVLYIIGHPAYGIIFGVNPNNAFVGFEVNGWADGQAFSSTTCIGTDVNGGGGSPSVWMHYMAVKGCNHGFGSNDDSLTYFLHSDHTDYGANNWGMYGHASDLESASDTFASESSGGIHFTGFGGEAHIVQGRFEFSPVGLDFAQYGGVNISNTQFDHLSNTSIRIGSTSADIYISNSSFQASGSTGTSGNEAHITLSKTTTSPVNLHLSNTIFTVGGEVYPKYAIEVTTTGSFNEGIEVTGGNAAGGYTKDFYNFVNGRPVNIKTDIGGLAIQGKNANGIFPAQSRGVPSNQWSALNLYGTAAAMNEQFVPLTDGFGALVGKQMGTAPTYYTFNDFSHFDCDIVDQKIIPNANPNSQNYPLSIWLPNPSEPAYGAGFYTGHQIDTNSCRLGGLTWATVPTDFKVYAQSSGCTPTGSWANNSHYSGALGMTSSTNGDTMACAITTYGGPVYLWYLMNGSNGGTFNYNLDGGSNTSVATQGQNSFTFPINSSSFTMGAVRIPNVSAGSHTVNVAVSSTTSASNTVTIEGIGTPPQKAFAAKTPTFVLGGQIPNTTYVAASAAFNNDEMNQASLLFLDGLPVLFADILNYWVQATDINSFGGNSHITTTGQQHLAQAYNGAIQAPRNDMNAVNPMDFGASCNTTYFPTSYNGSTSYTISTTNGSPVVSIGNYTFQPGVATQFGGGDVGKRICIFGEGGGASQTTWYDVGPCTYIASVNTTNNTATLGTNMAASIGGQGLITGYPSNPNVPSTAQDDTNAIQLASQAAQKGGGKVFLPNHCAVHNLIMAPTTSLEGNAGGNYYLAQGLGVDASPQAGPTVLYCAITGYPSDETRCINTTSTYNGTGQTSEIAFRNFMLQGIVFPYVPFGAVATGIGYTTGDSKGVGNGSESTLIEHVSFMNLPVGVGEALGYNQPISFTGQIAGNQLTVSAMTSANLAMYGGPFCTFGCMPEVLAVGRAISGTGVTGGSTIVTAPAGGRTGVYTLSATSSTASEAMTSAASTGAMAVKLRDNQFIVGVIGVNGDQTDNEWTGNIFTGTFLEYGVYMGPRLNGFGNGATRIQLGRFEEVAGAAIVCDGCGMNVADVDFQFNGGYNIWFKNGGGSTQITGGHMYAGGHCFTPNENKAMIKLSGNGTGVDVSGVILTNGDVGSGCGGTTGYLYATSTGSTMDYISVEGGANVNTETITGMFNWTNGTPAHYKQDIAGWPKIDTSQNTMRITTTGGVGLNTGTVHDGTILDMLNNTTTANSSILLPGGTTANRPSAPLEGMFRYNTNLHSVEDYNGTTWGAVGGSTVVPFSYGGLTLSNDGGTPNTVIDIAAGGAASDDSTTQMNLAAAVTKTTAAWALGSGNGCLDTGSVAASTWYHLFLIERVDTAVVDILCSTSATAPTYPTNYTVKRRIGSILTDGSANILAFKQDGSIFYWATPTLDVTTTTLGTSAVLQTLNVPPGVQVTPVCNASISNGSVPVSVYLSSPDQTDLATTTTSPFSGVPGYSYLATTTTGQPSNAACPLMTTNTSQQVRSRASAASTLLSIITFGWID